MHNMYAGMQGIRRKKIKNPVDKYCIYVYNNTQNAACKHKADN